MTIKEISAFSRAVTSDSWAGFDAISKQKENGDKVMCDYFYKYKLIICLSKCKKKCYKPVEQFSVPPRKTR